MIYRLGSCRAEKILYKMNPENTCEIINSAVPGYSTFQELRFLERHGLKLDPDMMILQFCLNDATERYATVIQYGGDNIFLGIDTRRSIKGLNGFPIRHSRSFEALFRRVINLGRRKEKYDVIKLARNALSKELQEAWLKTLKEINGIHHLAVSRHIPCLILIAPYRFQLENSEGERQPQNFLINYCKKK